MVDENASHEILEGLYIIPLFLLLCTLGLSTTGFVVMAGKRWGIASFRAQTLRDVTNPHRMDAEEKARLFGKSFDIESGSQFTEADIQHLIDQGFDVVDVTDMLKQD